MSKFKAGDRLVSGSSTRTVAAATDKQYWLMDSEGYCLSYDVSSVDDGTNWSKITPRFEEGGVYATGSLTEVYVVAVFDNGREAVAWYSAFDGCRALYIKYPEDWERVR